MITPSLRQRTHGHCWTQRAWRLLDGEDCGFLAPSGSTHIQLLPLRTDNSLNMAPPDESVPRGTVHQMHALRMLEGAISATGRRCLCC